MNNKKLTNVLALEMVLAMEEGLKKSRVSRKINKMKEQLRKNNSGTGSKKLTKLKLKRRNSRLKY